MDRTDRAPDTAPFPAITRETLQQDAIRHRFAQRHPEIPLLDNQEFRASIDRMLAARPEAVAAFDGVFVFAYGSLIWNPCVEVAERRAARLYGYHRDFRLHMPYGRGSPDAPGLMLALVGGGSCHGVALRVPATGLRDELLLVWRREMLTGVYRPRWVDLATPDGKVPAIAFVANTGHVRYLPRQDDATTIARLCNGCGELGSCADYLDRTVQDLRAWGIHDRRLEHLWHAVFGPGRIGGSGAI